MRKLNINGSITADTFNILSEQLSFYQELYTSRNMINKEIESVLKDLLIPKLSEEQKMSCEDKITSEECALLLECFQNNKSPVGTMELSLNSIKKFWPLISEPFIQCINECFEKGKISCSQKQAVITLSKRKERTALFWITGDRSPL